MKSIELIDRTIDEIKQDKELNEKFPGIAKRIRYFHSGVGCQSVTSQITEYLKTMPHGMIVFITHVAWQLLPDFHRKDRWRLIVDELMQTTYHEAFTLVSEEHRQPLSSRLVVTTRTRNTRASRRKIMARCATSRTIPNMIRSPQSSSRCSPNSPRRHIGPSWWKPDNGNSS